MQYYIHREENIAQRLGQKIRSFAKRDEFLRWLAFLYALSLATARAQQAYKQMQYHRKKEKKETKQEKKKERMKKKKNEKKNEEKKSERKSRFKD